jgi:lantibiotic leader peptide-processing serine protease
MRRERARHRAGTGVAVVTLAVAGLGLAGTAVAGAEGGSGEQSRTYVVVFKDGQHAAGARAVERAGGELLSVNKVGVATVAAGDAAFSDRVGTSGAVEDVGEDAYFKVQGSSAVQAPPFPDTATAAAGCAAQYQPPGGLAVGPDPLSACQWDMRISNASPTGSYAVNRGAGATIGILDTGVDIAHPDQAPNLDLGLSCSFIRPDTPTAIPADIEATSNCQTKSAVQDFFGHGAHVAGIAAAPINGLGVAGVAPEATVVALKAATAPGYLFTQPVVDGLVYAGDKRLDVVNMSFFADPYLYNCKNEATQRTIVKAISRAARYAHQRGVVLVGSAGNEATDLDHPEIDTTSPDFPPDSAETREVGNQCVVVPAELPWTTTVSAIGPQARLSFYSNWGNSRVDVTAAGGASDQAPNPYGRVLNVWSSTAPLTAAGNPTRTVEDCEPVCVRYAWIQGTSMASPHAAGVAALIRSRDPNMPAGAVAAALQNTAMPLACPAGDVRCSGGGGHTSFYGNGLVDALAVARD